MALVVGRTRIRVHPLMLLFPLAAAMLGAGRETTALLLSLSAHEAAHLLAARCLRVGVNQLRLMPFGGAIAMDNPYVLSPGRLFAVAAAGPAGSLSALVLSAALAHWGAIPPPMALVLLQANLLLLCFNLLPGLPLDGGRMLYALLFPRLGRTRAAELGILLGRIAAALLLTAAMAAAIVGGRLNLSPVLSAVFMLASAPDERRALLDARARTLLRELTPMGPPIPVRVHAVSSGCSLRMALRAADSSAVVLYAVYDGTALLGFTDDHSLLEAALKGSIEQPVSAAMPPRE